VSCWLDGREIVDDPTDSGAARVLDLRHEALPGVSVPIE
jgi:hypothetical protein